MNIWFISAYLVLRNNSPLFQSCFEKKYSISFLPCLFSLSSGFMLDLELILNLPVIQVVVLQGICWVQFNFFQNPSHALLAFPGILYVYKHETPFFSPHCTCHYSKVIPRVHVVIKLSANTQMLSKTTGLLVGNFVFYELFIWNPLLLGLGWWEVPSPLLLSFYQEHCNSNLSFPSPGLCRPPSGSNTYS